MEAGGIKYSHGREKGAILSGSDHFKLGLYGFDLCIDRGWDAGPVSEKTFFHDHICCGRHRRDYRLCTVFQYFCKDWHVGTCGSCGDGSCEWLL